MPPPAADTRLIYQVCLAILCFSFPFITEHLLHKFVAGTVSLLYMLEQHAVANEALVTPDVTQRTQHTVSSTLPPRSRVPSSSHPYTMISSDKIPVFEPAQAITADDEVVRRFST